MSGGGAVTAEPQEPELREPALQEPELREPALQEPELREPALQAPEEERLQLSGRQEEEAAAPAAPAAAVAVEPDPDPNPDPNPAPAPQLPAPGGCCPCAIPNANAETKKKASCPGLGLFYALLSAFFFSVASLLVKKIQDIHSTEISAFRCVFQMLFILPFLMYKKTGFVGPKGKRIFLLFRGIFGSTAMILLYYAFQLMPIADATVITFTTPVFTSLFACIYLKEKYSFWDLLFTLFAIAGVLLIARPPFLFGSNTAEIEDNHSHHLKGALAAVGSALCGALTLVILRKVGKSVHYLLSIWYYLVIGLLECVIALFVLGEWRLPHCGLDRLYLILIALLGLGGQIFITRALQIEKAGPVSIMKTMDVVFAFILQIIFLHKIPTWWTIGGALCVVTSSSGAVIRNWYNNSKVSHQS